MRIFWSALGAVCLLYFGPPAGKAVPRASPTPGHPRIRAADLYAPSVRRSVQSYLRLRLLELREADLERARLVIEGQLGIDALLRTPPPMPKDATRRNKP